MAPGPASGVGACLGLGLASPVPARIGMTHSELCQRTKAFAVAVAGLSGKLGPDPPLRNAAAQLARASASVASNYRAAGLARSRREFVAKLGLVIEEADECAFWLEYLQELHAARTVPDLVRLADESRQLVRIFTASRKTAKARC